MTVPVTQKGKCGAERSDNLPKATQLVNQQESFFFFNSQGWQSPAE